MANLHARYDSFMSCKQQSKGNQENQNILRSAVARKSVKVEIKQMAREEYEAA
ncbi:MAG: hypothetical protein HY066_07005 [Betaproteobacteria bacterium]|nr:hypothetical protein [Betaproteobacteria bacterium]